MLKMVLSFSVLIRNTRIVKSYSFKQHTSALRFYCIKSNRAHPSIPIRNIPRRQMNSSSEEGSNKASSVTSSKLLFTNIESEGNISRLSTLQSLLQKMGAPGASQECSQPNDLEPVREISPETLQLHPHLFPIAQSKTNPTHYICALRRAYADDAEYISSSNSPWPIVQATLNGPGYKLLSLNSEHYMRRLAATADFELDDIISSEIVDLYNYKLGEGLVEKGLDDPYENDSVSKLGYGLSKYVLLRVGPFPDLYEEMARLHSSKNDESSSLIAAEACNSKFTGFASTFAFYASLLSTFPNRADEVRDAAIMCLRLPLPSIGLLEADFVHIAQMAQLISSSSTEDAMESMKDLYEKIRKHEQDDDQSRANMTAEQLAIEEANYILDSMVFGRKGGEHTKRDWCSIRTKLSEIYSKAGMDDMAEFVNPRI